MAAVYLMPLLVALHALLHPERLWAQANVRGRWAWRLGPPLLVVAAFRLDSPVPALLATPTTVAYLAKVAPALGLASGFDRIRRGKRHLVPEELAVVGPVVLTGCVMVPFLVIILLVSNHTTAEKAFGAAMGIAPLVAVGVWARWRWSGRGRAREEGLD